MGLIENRLHELTPSFESVRLWFKPRRHGEKNPLLTAFLRSPFLTPSSPTKRTAFRIILAMRSSRNTTISWLNHLARQGFVPRVTFGTLARRALRSVSGKGARGSTEEDQGSVGPGTRRNCEWARRSGKEARRVASWVKSSETGRVRLRVWAERELQSTVETAGTHLCTRECFHRLRATVCCESCRTG